MKMILVLLFLTTVSQAGTISAQSGDMYIGKELYQNKATGNTCVIHLQEVNSIETKGLHCSKVSSKMFFHGKKSVVYLGENILYSRITNYHTQEYPRIKTCAEKVLDVDGQIVDADIYGEDDSFLFNRILSGEYKHRGVQYHSFLSFNSKSKELERARMHRLSWFTEKTWDCVNLVRQ